MGAAAAVGFKYGEDVCDAEEFADARAQVHQLQLAFRAFRRNVKSHQCAEAGAVHVREVGEIENHSAFGEQQRFHFRLQVRRGFRGKAPGATDYGRVFPSIRLQRKCAVAYRRAFTY